jgi:hypothetical protein
MIIIITWSFFLQRSLSFSREPLAASNAASKYRLPPQPGTPKTPSKKKTLLNPTLLNRDASRRKLNLARENLPDNWVELEGVAKRLAHYSKEEIKRQEVWQH